MKKLILNADDYGYREDISRAIIDSHIRGNLTSTTVLINFLTDEDLKLALTTPSLGFGLHLNITSGKPTTKDWIEKYGEFSRPKRNQPGQFDYEQWVPFISKYSTDHVYEEYKSQYDLFLEKFGKKPTHVDAHHYNSSFENTFSAFKKLAKTFGLSVRQPVSWATAENQHPMGNIVNRPDQVEDLNTNNIKTTQYFSTLYLNRSQEPFQDFENELSKLSDTDSAEISFHPGYDEDWRKADLDILCSDDVNLLLKKNNVQLVNYSNI